MHAAKGRTGLFAFPVLLNAQPVTLPALRAGCMTDDGPADFYILDQPDYPLMLSWKLGSGSQLQVIKITYPPSPHRRRANRLPGNRIEQQLKEKKKVDIYGIYFDFASDRLKPESTPVLDEIAGVLKDNPGLEAYRQRSHGQRWRRCLQPRPVQTPRRRGQAGARDSLSGSTGPSLHRRLRCNSSCRYQ